jgi:hypothetical protein
MRPRNALLLAVLEPGPQHGYAIIESLRSGSDGALDLPTRPLAVIATAASLTRIACSITTVRHATRMRSRLGGGGPCSPPEEGGDGRP